MHDEGASASIRIALHRTIPSISITQTIECAGKTGMCLQLTRHRDPADGVPRGAKWLITGPNVTLVFSECSLEDFVRGYLPNAREGSRMREGEYSAISTKYSLVF